MSSLAHQEALRPFHIYFTCPHCNAVRQVPEQYVGQSGSCNDCGGAITINSNTAPALPIVPVAARPREWFRERSQYLEFCRKDYDSACAQFSMEVDDAHWQERIREATSHPGRAEQVSCWERLVAEGFPWPVAFEYLVHYYAKERNYERAHYFCSIYFLSDRWKNPQCVGSTHKLLKTMRKLEKKLFEN
jgi:hypothetical protein